MAEELNLDQFRATFQSGGFRSVSVVAAAGSFFVTAQPRTGDRVTLATTHGKKRRAFRDAGKAIAILHELGARKVEVDTSEWSPKEAGTEANKRPDTAERQRRIHAAAEHDAWFRAEVRKAIKVADDPTTEWVPNEEAKRQSAIRRIEWLKKAALQEAVV
jgi:hypothetical protein